MYKGLYLCRTHKTGGAQRNGGIEQSCTGAIKECSSYNAIQTVATGVSTWENKLRTFKCSVLFNNITNVNAYCLHNLSSGFGNRPGVFPVQIDAAVAAGAAGAGGGS